MAEGRRIEAWWHTSALLAMLYNINRSKNARAMDAKDFHPYFKAQAASVRLKDLVQLGILKGNEYGGR